MLLVALFLALALLFFELGFTLHFLWVIAAIILVFWPGSLFGPGVVEVAGTTGDKRGHKCGKQLSDNTYYESSQPRHRQMALWPRPHGQCWRG
jgi:hypothetical protein